MDDLLSMILSLALMVPFFGWGVYTLRARYQFHEELHRSAEWLTILGVGAFFAIEMSLMRVWLYDRPGMFALTGLALTVSMAALYGHIMISLASSVFVEAVMPNMDPESQMPQFGPAEALERIGDHDGALQEYLVIARIFPKDPETCVRIANNLVQLERYDEAVKAFERGFTLTKVEEDALGIANRMHVLYKERLNRPEDAKRILQRFLERYPLSPRSDSVIRRLSTKGSSSSVMRIRQDVLQSAPAEEVSLEATEVVEMELELPTAMPDSTWEAPPVVPEKPKSAPKKSASKPPPSLSLDWSTADETPPPKRPANPSE